MDKQQSKLQRALQSGALRRSALNYLTEQERRKYELAIELGLLEKLKQVGWAGLSTKETGRIGGLLARDQGKRQ